MSETNAFYKENYIFGLDIGTRSIVGLVGYPTAGSLNIIADYVLEHDTRAMLDGQIHDVEKVAQSIKKVKAELEKTLGFPLKKVCIAAAGRVLKTKTVHVEQEVDPNIAIDEDRIFAIELLGIEKAHQEVNRDLTNHESGFHCVGYTVSKYFLNEYEIGKLHGHKGKVIGADVLATFLPKEVVESLHQVVNSAGLEVFNLTLEPIAAINIAIPHQYRLLNIALVDIGAGTSDIAITKEGSVIAYGMIPVAGDEITETIVHHYLVDFKMAEMIKIKSSGKSKIIAYKDIMGLSHKVTPEEVNDQIKEASQKLAEKISQKIIELNGGHPTNAVFLVGGGGQLSGFTNLLAGYLNIPYERVALRGKAVLEAVSFETGTKKSPELVTPLGICFSGLDGNKREFMQVFLNDEPVKVFDTNNLTVMDIAAFKGINPKNLIIRRGANLTFTLNQLEKTIKGEGGEPAKILINNTPSSLNDRVIMNDYITIVDAKKGKDAALSTNQLLEQIHPLHININDQSYPFKPKLLLNDIFVTLNYDLHNGDQVVTVPPTIVEILNQLELPFIGKKILLNGNVVTSETIVGNNDVISLIDENSITTKAPEVKEKTTPLEQQSINSIKVLVNGQFITMNSKKNYVFVDIFDYYAFDLSKPKGIVECEINGTKSTYMEPIHDGDVIKVYWSDTKQQ
ncbi:MAG: cell division protein FtsA [Vallitaleaceae bacterium]|nr:cell division protein FtsA [Vallitaleaceae bacterium]